MKNSFGLFKIFCLKYFLYIVINVLCTNVLYAENWPTLFMPEDFIPKNTPKEKQENKYDEKYFQKTSESDLRKSVLSSFYFIADFESSMKGELPRNWFDAKKNPETTLLKGFPSELKRPELVINFPVYTLNKLTYFISNDIYFSKLNICIEFWSQNRLQKAYDCFYNMQIDFAKNNISVSSIPRINTSILQAFFLIYLEANHIKDVHRLAVGVFPPQEVDLNEGDFYLHAKSLLSIILIKTDESFLIKSKNQPINSSLYKSFFNNPQYFHLAKKIGGKNPVIKIDDQAIEPETWLRTVMPFMYADIFAMCQEVLLWERGFRAATKLENFIASLSLPKIESYSPIQIEGPANVTNAIFIAPKTTEDFIASIDLYRENSSLVGSDPIAALEYASKGLMHSAHPEMNSLFFTITANTYFDYQLLRLARRSYSWSELSSKSFATKVPSSLFFGAETAFWLGEYSVARKAFERFLLLIGDPLYGPWAQLRLAEIAEIQKDTIKSQIIYEQIVKKFDKHEASKDAQVRLFCLYEKNFTPNVRKVEYEKVLVKIKESSEFLKKQAKACLLRADLMSLSEKSKEDKKTNVVEKAQQQKTAIAKYAEEFPKSEFIVLFSDQLKELDLASATFFAEENKCQELISFYSKNKNELIQLSKNNHQFVSGLKWDAQDRRKLLRCAAFVQNMKMWDEARTFDVGSDMAPLQNQLYKLRTLNSAQSAIDAYEFLKKSSAEWFDKLTKVEKSGDELTDRNDFWELLLVKELSYYHLNATLSAKYLLNQAILRDLFKKPENVFSSELFCQWMLGAVSQFTSEDWDVLAHAKTSEQWVEIQLTENKSKLSKCQVAFADRLVAVTLTHPSDYRDKSILLPYLQKKGFVKGGEEWLTFVQRLETKRAHIDPEITNIYYKLQKESSDPLVKSAASAWIKKNIQKDSDKVLW